MPRNPPPGPRTTPWRLTLAAPHAGPAHSSSGTPAAALCGLRMEVDMTKQLTQDRTESGSTPKRHGFAATVLAATTLAVGAGSALAAPGDPSSSARDRDAVAERFDEARQNVDSLDEIGRVVVREVKVEEPRKEKREKPEPEPEAAYGTPESVGVSQATLDS